MLKSKFVHNPTLFILLILFIIFSTCSCTYQGDEFTFSAPSGFKTNQFKSSGVNLNQDAELLLFSQKGHLYFQVFRQAIPPKSDLDTIFSEYVTRTSQIPTNYQLISKNRIEINNRPAIEYIHREFAGEPYVQRREIWMEYKGRAYSLVCTNPVDATPGATNPVAELCVRLVEGFQFKDQ